MASCLRLASSSSSRPWTALSTIGRRYLHKRKPLPYSAEEGLGKFLPPPALATLLEYQDGLLERLNAEVRGVLAEPHHTVAQRVVEYSTRRDRVLAFNYAVLALNNSFFLEHLAPPPPEGSPYPNHQSKISEFLFEKIRSHYGDLLRFKSAFSAAASGMFTNGWVWMVTDRDGNLGVLQTLGPSTLLVRSRSHMHPNGHKNLVVGEEELLVSPSFTDLPVRPLPNPPSSSNPPPGVSPSLPTSGVSSPNFDPNPFDPHARSLHFTASRLNVNIGTTSSLYGERPKESEVQGKTEPSILSVGKMIYPLFCIPVYEHAWMSAGFGVWGKEAWLTELWAVLDWQKISFAYKMAREGDTRNSKSLL
ncbi:hypothetical protein CVT26_010972 [Gymnopilus dilepis]|uniref:Manganese/iron superoxide dismutase C-terminal domain-containing protein n=1 Tax=Gymnopilus dilepis TaxID=231916 RepID=A0A409VJ57_9AGAR|nr:hypothetical protein CVT26_010972 [Gymnopilus dilepis]